MKKTVLKNNSVKNFVLKNKRPYFLGSMGKTKKVASCQ